MPVGPMTGGQQRLELTSVCTFCGHSNELTATATVASLEVRCSQCGAALGYAGDLQRETADLQREEPSEAGRNKTRHR